MFFDRSRWMVSSVSSECVLIWMNEVSLLQKILRFKSFSSHSCEWFPFFVTLVLLPFLSHWRRGMGSPSKPDSSWNHISTDHCIIFLILLKTVPSSFHPDHQDRAGELLMQSSVYEKKAFIHFLRTRSLTKSTWLGKHSLWERPITRTEWLYTYMQFHLNQQKSIFF